MTPAADPPADPPAGPPPAESGTWARVHELFHTALGLEPAARAEFLASLAADDPALAREVHSLLDAHGAASGFLARSPGPPRLDGVAVGELLGPYRIVEEIGRGGMGVVYRATRSDESFTKDVAIKLIDPGMRSDEILKRFRAERQILAMLDHPNIARLLDGGTAPDGGPYLVMEYVSGKSLLDYCDALQLGIDARIALFLTVCDAVQFAHQRLVVHRDLKSDNILVTADGSPRLLDFGIAKLLSPESGLADGTVTAPMNRMLTPDYASPEQIRGEPAAVASDVYSLGVILYELLSGSRPLRFTTRTPEEILRIVTQVDPAPPSTVVTRSPDGEAARHRGATTQHLRRQLSGDLDYVALKALEKDPARRYGSVEQMAQDIRRHLEGLPVLARGQSTSYRVSRFVRRHRAAVAATALVVLALLGGLAGTAWQANVAGRERDRAKRRFDDVRALAHAVVFDIHDAIARLPGSTKARETLVRYALRYLDGLAKESAGDPVLQHEMGVAYSRVGDVQGQPMFPNLGQSAEALASYDHALALLASAVRAMPESTEVAHDLTVVEQRRADLLGVMGRPADAMRQALATRDRVRAQLARHPDDPALLNDLAFEYGRLRDMKLAAADTAGALAEGHTYLAVCERAFRAHPTDPGARRAALVAYAKMGELWTGLGARDSALIAYERATALALDAVRAQPENTDAQRDLSIAYGLQGLYLAEGGAFDSALVVYGRAMAISEQLAAADPQSALQQSDVAVGHYDIGEMLMKRGDQHAAEQRFGTAFELGARLAAADTGSAEHRFLMAHAARRAGEVCQAQSRRGTPAARLDALERARLWLGRSLALYAGLERAGALQGEEAAAPAELRQLLRGVQSAPGPAPESSR